MRKIHKKLLISAILLTIILSISMASLSANAKTSKIEQISAIDQSTYSDMWLKSNATYITTTSNVPVDIPGLTTTITTKYPSDLVVLFSAIGGVSSSNTRMYIAVYIDGVRISPGAIELIPGGFNFQKQNLPAGKHTVKIKWWIDMPPPESGFMFYRTLTIIANGAGHP